MARNLPTSERCNKVVRSRPDARCGEASNEWRSLAILSIIVGLIGLGLATHVATRIIRDSWSRARDNAMQFCRDLADVADGLATTHPTVAEALDHPPIPASLLVYLRDRLIADIQSCIGPSYTTEQEDRYAVGLPIQIAKLCISLTRSWEEVTGLHVSRLGVHRTSPEDSQRVLAGFQADGWALRERVTLLHQQFLPTPPRRRDRGLSFDISNPLDQQTQRIGSRGTDLSIWSTCWGDRCTSVSR